MECAMKKLYFFSVIIQRQVLTVWKGIPINILVIFFSIDIMIIKLLIPIYWKLILINMLLKVNVSKINWIQIFPQTAFTEKIS